MGQGAAALRDVKGDTAVYTAKEKQHHLMNMVQKLKQGNAPTYEEIQVLLVVDKKTLVGYLTDVFNLAEEGYEFRPFRTTDQLKNHIRPIFAHHLLAVFQQGFGLEAQGEEEPANVNVDDFDIGRRVNLLKAMMQLVEQGNAPTLEQVLVLLAVNRDTLVQYLTDVFGLAEDNVVMPPDWPVLEEYDFRPIKGSDTLYQHIRPIFTYHFAKVFMRGFHFEPPNEAEGVLENVVQGIQNMGLAEEANEGQAQGPANAAANKGMIRRPEGQHDDNDG